MMRVNVENMLRQAGHAIPAHRDTGAYRHMLQQLAGHLRQLRDRTHADDLSAIAEFFKLYVFDDGIEYRRPAAGPLKLDTDRHVFFYEQDHYYLSNFSAFNLRLGGGLTFPTAEHAYHWHKFPESPDLQCEIRRAPSAHEAFKLAEREKISRRGDWDDIKVDTMRILLRMKAQQHEYVRRKLLQTGDRELIENSWRDDVWGWGPNRDGQNMLGKLWMEIRAELRSSGGAA